ncbi:MAG: GNAT family N-acetyltransferase [Myxococcota bacterium]|nr:GNAT family N-acetyltransferase [Myxococcota bacterium]
MPRGVRTLTIELLRCSDVVAVAQCITIDATAFPYASAHFGQSSAAHFVWVARDGSEPRVLGFIAEGTRRGALHLEGVAVDEGVRRRGIGRALVRGSVARARSAGLRAVGLQVSITNRAAIALYDAEGFTIERRLRGYYPPSAFNGVTEAYAMVLEMG